MELLPLQQNFAAGEISPRFLCRTDLQAYTAGVSEMTNIVPYSQGPATRRRGTRYLDSYPGSDGRVFDFRVARDEGFAIVITDQGKLYINDSDGVPVGPGLLTNPRFDELGTGWTASETNRTSVDFEPGVCNLELYSNANTSDYATIAQSFTFDPAGDDHKLIVQADTISGATIRVIVGSTPGGNDLGDWTFSGEGMEVTFDKAGNTTGHLEVSLLKSDNPAGGVHLRSLYAVFLALIGSVSSRVEFDTPAYSVEDLDSMQVEMSPAGTTLYMFTRRWQPHKLVYNRTLKSWNYTPVSFVNPPAEWTGTNWPGAVFFFEGRMWVGGTPDEQNYLWASRSGVYEDFDIPGTGAVADDPFVFVMSKFVSIKWISGLREMMVGTDTGEWVARSTDGDILWVSNTTMIQQSEHGSLNRQPARVGNNILFISPDGTKLRDTGFRWTEDAWVARDLSYVSEHLTTRDSTMLQVIWAPNPENFLLVPMSGGELLWGVYDWNNNIVGWSRSTTDGSFVDAAALQRQGISAPYMLTRRVNNGNIELHLEQVTKIWMDDSKTEIIQGGMQILDATHLLGETVAVTTNDDFAVHPDVVISDGGPQGPTNPDDLPAGQANLQWPAESVTYGRSYMPKLVTLPLEAATNQGSSMALKKRYNKVIVRLLESAHPTISSTMAPEREPATPMDTSQPDFTGDSKAIDLGWDEYASVIIEQPLPRALTILGIFGEATQYKL